MILSMMCGKLCRPLRNMFISSQLPMVYLTFHASISKSLMYWSMSGKQKESWSRLACATSCFVESANCDSNLDRKLMYIYLILLLMG